MSTAERVAKAIYEAQKCQWPWREMNAESREVYYAMAHAAMRAMERRPR